MAVKPVVYDDTTKKHRPLGSGEKMDGLSASSIVSSQSGNLITTGSDGLAYATGSGIADPSADNLLETTSSGKLKMDVDRLSEWLDGHPADAKAFSEAVKVVSADSGNVITKGSDKGAYLAKGDISSAVSGMTDAQKQTLAAALADGTTVTASGGKLHAATQAGDAAQLADGKTIVASGGKLTANLTNATVAQKKAIAQALAGEGLLVNSSSGKLDVDFESMDDTKFRMMMQGFIDKQTIKRTGGGNHFYVDGSNANSDGDREPSASDPRPDMGGPSDPFHTIQYCVDYITQVYKFADVNTYINCKNVSQTDMLSLPSFDRTTAEITIRSAGFTASTERGQVDSTSTGYDISIERAPTAGSRFAVRCMGTGVWNLRNFDAYCKDDNLESSGGHLAALRIEDYASVSIDYCRFKARRRPDEPWREGLTTGEHVLMVAGYGSLAIGGYCTIVGDDLSSSPYVISSGDHAGSYRRELYGISIVDSGTVRINNAEGDRKLVFSGNFYNIVRVTSYIVRNTAYSSVSDTSAVANADYRFNIEAGGRGRIVESGRIDGTHNDGDATDTWLGTVSTNQDGTSRISHVQTETYSWYD